MATESAHKPEFRGRIYDSVIDTIGATPLVRLKKLEAKSGVKAELVAKLEFFNPLASVKDRIGLAMIEAGLTVAPELATAARAEYAAATGGAAVDAGWPPPSDSAIAAPIAATVNNAAAGQSPEGRWFAAMSGP